jgi:hypothetical protein
MVVLKKAVQYSGNSGGIVAEHFAPVLDGSGSPVTPQSLRKVISAFLARSSIYEQGHGSQELHVLPAGAVDRGVGDLLEQHVSLAINHPIHLRDDRLSDGLGQVAFALAGWT